MTRRPRLARYVLTETRLKDAPRFYNTLTANCMTIISQLVDQIVPGLPMSYRLLLSGYLPEYLCKLGALEEADSPQAYPKAGRYTERARAPHDVTKYPQYPPRRSGYPPDRARHPAGPAVFAAVALK